jgi:Rrf2 family protein
MRLSAQEEYGLRCLVQVALAGTERPVQIAEIAGREGLSVEYTAKLLRVLRQGGLIQSVRGAGGGYVLARPAREITVAQAIDVLDGQLFDAGFCETHAGKGAVCVHTSAGCSIRSLWRWIGAALDRVLEQVTLADLASGEIAVASQLREAARPPFVEIRATGGER